MNVTELHVHSMVKRYATRHLNACYVIKLVSTSSDH